MFDAGDERRQRCSRVVSLETLEFAISLEECIDGFRISVCILTFR